MKPPPRSPMARQALSIDLLCQDIAEGKGFDRLKALSHVVKQLNGEGGNG